MTAELLREAAALMRERAVAVLEEGMDAPWRVSIHDASQVMDTGDRLVLSAEGLAEAEHTASWHPLVALAVADWLDAVAVRVEMPHYRGWTGAHQAGSVARAYLGRDA